MPSRATNSELGLDRRLIDGEERVQADNDRVLRGYTVTRQPDGTITITTPNGELIR